MKKKQKKLLTSRLRIKFIYVIVILTLFDTSLFANPLEDASQMERDGKQVAAINLYRQWLSSNLTDPKFTEILMYTVSVEPSVDKSLKDLIKYEEYIHIEKKQSYYLRIAQLYELIFNINKASIYYKKASHNKNGILNVPIFLKHLQMNYQLGEIPDIRIINDILLSNIDREYHVNALIFKSEIFKYNNDYNSALTILKESEYKNIYPEIMLALRDLYLWNNDFNSAKKIIQEAERIFPDSIEYKIMKGDVTRIVRLSDFFLNRIDSKSYIQVAVFSNQKNVDVLCEKLKKNDFNYFLITENLNTKIIVEDSIPADDLMTLLKEKGFTGFKVDYQQFPE